LARDPAPPGQRRRRNKDNPQYRTLDKDGRKGPVPSLGARPDRKAWLKQTREWWAEIWRSPMALAWLDSDIYVLRRLARYKDDEARGEKGLSTAIVNIEDRFGLSPLGRRRLMWEIGRASAEAEQPAEKSKPGQRRTDDPRLRAIAGGKA
jgi:hypothetical protein